MTTTVTRKLDDWTKDGGRPPDLTYLSLGFGVQSWALAAMIAVGELPPVDVAIHADTTHEADGTYRHAEKWTGWLEERGVNVVTVRPDRIATNMMDQSRQGVFIPAFTKSHDDQDMGRLSRQCTERWKIRPIKKHIRSLIGNKPRPEAVYAILGISLDEWSRMRHSDAKYIRNVYPLVDLRMSRADCATWLQRQGLEVPPKSACTFCPYHNPAFWQRMKQAGGPDWEDAKATDEAIRHRRPNHDLYLHPAGIPLADAVLIPEDNGATQMTMEIPCDSGFCFH